MTCTTIRLASLMNAFNSKNIPLMIDFNAFNNYVNLLNL